MLKIIRRCDARDGPRDIDRRRDGGLHVHDEDRIVFIISKQRVKRNCIASRICVANDVHGVGFRPGDRQSTIKDPAGRIADPGRSSTEVDQPINGKDA